MLKKLLSGLIFFICFSCAPVLSSDSLEVATGQDHFFQTIRSQALAPEQLQLLANALVISITRARTELIIDALLKELFIKTWRSYAHSKKFISYKEELSACKDSLRLLQEQVFIREAIIDAHNLVMQIVENPEHSAVYASVKAVADHATDHIQQYCFEQKDSLKELYKQSEQLCKKTIKALDLIANTSIAIYQEAYPMDTVNQEQQKTVTVQLAYQLGDALDEHIEKLFDIKTLLQRPVTQVQEVGISVLGAGYSAAYALMKENALDERFFTFMVNSEGIIPQEYRKQFLPNPYG